MSRWGILARLATTCGPRCPCRARPPSGGGRRWPPRERSTSPRRRSPGRCSGSPRRSRTCPGSGDRIRTSGALHRVGDVLGKLGDPLHLDAPAQLDLVAGDRRAAGEAGDRGVHVELFEHAGQRGDHLVVGLGPGLRRGALPRSVGRRQRVVASASPVSASCSARLDSGPPVTPAGGRRPAPRTPACPACLPRRPHGAPLGSPRRPPPGRGPRRQLPRPARSAPRSRPPRSRRLRQRPSAAACRTACCDHRLRSRSAVCARPTRPEPGLGRGRRRGRRGARARTGRAARPAGPAPGAAACR